MHILPKKSKSTAPHASNEPRVLATQTGNSHGNDNSNRGKSNNQGRGGKFNNYGKSNRASPAILATPTPIPTLAITVPSDNLAIPHNSVSFIAKQVIQRKPVELNIKTKTIWNSSIPSLNILTKPLGIIKHADAIQLVHLTQFPFDAASSML